MSDVAPWRLRCCREGRLTTSASRTTRQLAFSGVLWVTAEKWTVRVLGSLVFFILARLLEPADFGLVGLAYSAVAFFGIFVDQGIGTALVTRKEVTKEHSDSAFYAAVLSGAVMVVIAMAAAPVFADIVDQPLVRPVVQVLAVGFLLSALQTVPAALLTREMDFRTQALRRTCAAVSGAVAGVGLAVAGYGVWALVAQALVANVVGAVVLYTATSWRPGRRGTWLAFCELWRVGIRLLGLNFLTYLNEQGDNLVVGGYAGPVPLGLYAVGTRLLRVVLDLFTSVVVPIALPGFTRLQGDPAAVRRAFLLATRLSSFAAMPLFLGLAATAPVLIPWVFGDQWRGSVPVMQALALVGLVHCVTYFDRALLLASDRAGLELRLTMLATVGNLIAFSMVIPFGITGVAVALAVRNYATWPVRIWALNRVAGIPPVTYLRQWGSSLLPALPSTGWLLYWASGIDGDPTWQQVIVGAAVALALYPLVCRLVQPTLLREVTALSLELLRRKTRKAPA